MTATSLYTFPRSSSTPPALADDVLEYILNYRERIARAAIEVLGEIEAKGGVLSPQLVEARRHFRIQIGAYKSLPRKQGTVVMFRRVAQGA